MREVQSKETLMHVMISAGLRIGVTGARAPGFRVIKGP